MVDPDAPSRESHSCRSWLHWIVGNIKVSRILHQSVLQKLFFNLPSRVITIIKIVCLFCYLLVDYCCPLLGR